MNASGATEPPVFDSRRAFWGRGQLSVYEDKVLGWARQKPVRVIFAVGVAEFWSGPRKIRTETAKRLIAFNYLLPLDPPLLPGLLAQTYVSRPQ